jgi:hypothetical protein
VLLCKIRTNETVFAIRATSPVLKIDDEAGDVAVGAVTAADVDGPPALLIEWMI